MCKRCVHKATETEFAVKVRKPLVNARNATDTALHLDFLLAYFLLLGVAWDFFCFVRWQVS